jgi:hypothetical protein
MAQNVDGKASFPFLKMINCPSRKKMSLKKYIFEAFIFLKYTN